MQTYYELGYAHALDKLGMTSKTAGIGQKFLGLFGRGAKAAPEASALSRHTSGPMEWGSEPAAVLSKGKKAPPRFKDSPKAPVVESNIKPEMKEQPVTPTTTQAETPKGETPKGETKAVEPGFLRRNWLPIAGGLGLAGLGGYAYLRNRDPMGGVGQLPSGQ